ncbi:hypothetical protein BDW22DRAFT_1321295, partial [Trametopsis cervina]
LGEKKQDMLFVSTIATAPTSQHRGYASTLIQLVTDEQADRRGRATYLFSSNHEANVPFYNSLGFYAVTTYQVGDTNPTWNERPVVVGVVSLSSQITADTKHGVCRWSENLHYCPPIDLTGKTPTYDMRRTPQV